MFRINQAIAKIIEDLRGEVQDPETFAPVHGAGHDPDQAVSIPGQSGQQPDVLAALNTSKPASNPIMALKDVPARVDPEALPGVT